jgi:hypothetical protein
LRNVLLQRQLYGRLQQRGAGRLLRHLPAYRVLPHGLFVHQLWIHVAVHQ